MNDIKIFEFKKDYLGQNSKGTSVEFGRSIWTLLQ